MMRMTVCQLSNKVMQLYCSVHCVAHTFNLYVAAACTLQAKSYRIAEEVYVSILPNTRRARSSYCTFI